MGEEFDIASGAIAGKADRKKDMLANTLRQANGLLGKLKGIAPSSMPKEPENQATIDGVSAGMDALSVASNFDPSGITKGIVMGNQTIGAIGGIVGGFLPKTESDGAPAFSLENTSKIGLPGLFMDIEAQSTNRRKFYQDKNEKTFKANLAASNRDTKNRDTLGYTEAIYRHGGDVGAERKECPIEIENDEVLIRKDNDGKWFIVLETGENTRSHDEEHTVGEEKESGAIIVAKEGDQVFNKDFKDEVIEAVKAGDRKYIERVLIPERDRYKEQMEQDEENEEYSTWEYDYDNPKGKYKKICCGEDHVPVSHKARMARNGMSMRGKRRKDIQRSIGAMKAAAKRKAKYGDGGAIGDKKKKETPVTPAPSYSWSGESQITKPVAVQSVPKQTKSETLVTRDRVEQLKNDGKAMNVLKAKPKPENGSTEDYLAWGNSLTPEETQLIARSSHNKALEPFYRSARIAGSNDMRLNGGDKRMTLEGFATETGAIGDKFRTSNEPNVFDDYLNPAAMIGNMASGLGAVPDNINKGNYLEAAWGVAAPLAAGAVAGIGANTTRQFANNLVNPFAGTGQIVNNLGNKYLPNAYRINPYGRTAEKLFTQGNLRNNLPVTNPKFIQRGVSDKAAIEDLLTTGIVRNKKSAGLPSKERWKETVFWGEQGDAIATNNYNIIARNSKGLKNRPVSHDDIVDIQVRGENGEYTSLPNWKEEINKPHWSKGYKELKRPSLNNTNKEIINIPVEWKIRELPGLHLKSTMNEGPVSKIIESKTGLINTEQALAIIGKESGGVDKVALIKKAFGGNIPKKIDYNDFRKIVQDQLIPLERKFVNHNSNYGVGRLGYPKSNANEFALAIKKEEELIERYKKEIELGATENEFRLKNSIDNLNFLKSKLNELPLENQTITFSNKGKLGKGSDAHGNPQETLGHAHFLRSAESPDVLTVTQIQSDAFQGTHREMPVDVSRAQFSLQRMDELQGRNKSVLNKMKKEGVDEAGVPVHEHQIKQFEDIVREQESQNIMKKAELENFTQKQLLDKTHQERYLQEIVDFASKRGDLKKIRLPTTETAVKIQNYAPQKGSYGINDDVFLIDGRKGVLKEPFLLDEVSSYLDLKKVEINGIVQDIPISNFLYSLDKQTILKKYLEQPKLIKKLFGEEPKIVTDNKGNTWHEFDIPEKYKQGKGEVKAFSNIGTVGLGLGASATYLKEKHRNGGSVKLKRPTYQK